MWYSLPMPLMSIPSRAFVIRETAGMVGVFFTRKSGLLRVLIVKIRIPIPNLFASSMNTMWRLVVRSIPVAYAW